ncbi:hypothetical protein M6D81_15390 [Paenibacillus sp. J5C_2022]|uniref:hypothetical protein n=1 Tax=Paenibacillus sp. J5C2022 TaxID=2977129 RepID=UPI0021D1C921|nr:hypothetical protein [Paenibacillus sp. J5C2022]MCU6710080.1 hypothetical protein [Paenibacillus sp. J5C2022]
MAQPIISWYDATDSEITGVYDFQTIDAGTSSVNHEFTIFNNRNGSEDVSKMEDVEITTVDMNGGDGDQAGNIVEAVKDKWFWVKVDTLNEVSFTQIGGSTAKKALGTLGSTKNPNAVSAPTWAVSTAYLVGDYVKPTSGTTYIYKCVTAGTSGGSEPTWPTIDGDPVTDGSVEWETILVQKQPQAQEILGLANDGTETNSGGNFAKVSMYADIPLSASAGRNNFKIRVSYRYV